MKNAFKGFEDSMRESDQNRPYEVPDRSGKPLKDIYDLPQREYKTVMDARNFFGNHDQAIAIERAFCGHPHSFANLNPNDERDVLAFLSDKKMTFSKQMPNAEQQSQ